MKSRATDVTDAQLASLPKWAQDYIFRLDEAATFFQRRYRELERDLRELTDETMVQLASEAPGGPAWKVAALLRSIADSLQ